MALVTEEEATTSAREQGSIRESILTTTSRWCGAPLVHRTLHRIPLPRTSRSLLWAFDSAQSDKRSENTKDPVERGLPDLPPHQHLPHPSLTISLGLCSTRARLSGPTAHLRGATGKTARRLRQGLRELVAFGEENHESGFDWEKVYNERFDVPRWHGRVSFHWVVSR